MLNSNNKLLAYTHVSFSGLKKIGADQLLKWFHRIRTCRLCSKLKAQLNFSRVIGAVWSSLLLSGSVTLWRGQESHPKQYPWVLSPEFCPLCLSVPRIVCLGATFMSCLWPPCHTGPALVLCCSSLSPVDNPADPKGQFGSYLRVSLALRCPLQTASLLRMPDQVKRVWTVL